MCPGNKFMGMNPWERIHGKSVHNTNVVLLECSTPTPPPTEMMSLASNVQPDNRLVIELDLGGGTLHLGPFGFSRHRPSTDRLQSPHE